MAENSQHAGNAATFDAAFLRTIGIQPAQIEVIPRVIVPKFANTPEGWIAAAEWVAAQRR